MRRESEPFMTSLAVPARIEAVREAAGFLVETARSLQIEAAANPLFEVAIVEALNNAVSHNPRDGQTSLHCELELEGRALRIRVLDDAARAPVQFAIPSIPAPSWADGSEAWEGLPEGGYGMYLIQSVFSTVRPCSRDGRHGLEMELIF
jgi:anti-sigma regulatory factor (Ser/Thr protein kinase)